MMVMAVTWWWGAGCGDDGYDVGLVAEMRRWGWWRWCVATGVRRRCGGGKDDGSGLMMKRVVVMWLYSGDGVGWVLVMRR
ncbi:hypothetical protein Tco_0026042 [Tanacetum coccineum]